VRQRAKRTKTPEVLEVEELRKLLAELPNPAKQLIRRGIEQLDRGEGISEDQLDAHLTNLKTKLK
jgi:hypothetical protein